MNQEKEEDKTAAAFQLKSPLQPLPLKEQIGKSSTDLSSDKSKAPSKGAMRRAQYKGKKVRETRLLERVLLISIDEDGEQHPGRAADQQTASGGHQGGGW